MSSSLRSATALSLRILVYCLLGIVAGAAAALGLFSLDLLPARIYIVSLIAMTVGGGTMGIALAFYRGNEHQSGLLRTVVIGAAVILGAFLLCRAFAYHEPARAYAGLFIIFTGAAFATRGAARLAPPALLAFAALVSVAAFVTTANPLWLAAIFVSLLCAGSELLLERNLTS